MPTQTLANAELSQDLSPAGLLLCPTQSRRPKSQGGWWIVSAGDDEAVHFVRLPPEARSATLLFDAEGDWVIKILAPAPYASSRLATPIAAFDARSANGRGGCIDLLKYLAGSRDGGNEVATRDTVLPKTAGLGDPALFLILGKAGLGKSPAIFKSVRVIVSAPSATEFEAAFDAGQGETPFSLEPGAEALRDARPMAKEVFGLDSFPAAIEGRDGRIECFQGGAAALAFVRDAPPVSLDGRHIGHLHLALFGRKIALGAMPGRLQVLYDDGMAQVFPFTEAFNCGNAVRENWMKGPQAVTGPSGPTHLPAARLSWIAPTVHSYSPAVINLEYGGVFTTAWANPRPGVGIQSVSFIGARGRSELYLLGARATPPGVRLGLAAQDFSPIVGGGQIRLWLFGINELAGAHIASAIVKLARGGREVARRQASLDMTEGGGTMEEVAFAADGLPAGRYEAILEDAGGARLDFPLEFAILEKDWRRRPGRKRGALEASLRLDEARPETMMRLRLTGFLVIGLKIPWRAFEPAAGRYEYAAVDTVVDRARRLGLLLSVALDCGGARACPAWLDLEGRDETGRRVGKPSLFDARFYRAFLKAWQALAKAYGDDPAVAAFRLDLLGADHVWRAEPGRTEGYEPQAREAFVEWLKERGYGAKDVAQWMGNGARGWSALQLPSSSNGAHETLRTEAGRFRSQAAAAFRDAVREAIERAAPGKDIVVARDASREYSLENSGESLEACVERLARHGGEWRVGACETHGRTDLFGKVAQAVAEAAREAAGKAAAGEAADGVAGEAAALAGEVSACPPHEAAARDGAARLATLGGRLLSAAIDPGDAFTPSSWVGALPALDLVARCVAAPSNVGLFVCEPPAGRSVAAVAARFTRLNLHHLPVFDFQSLDPSRIRLLVDAGNARINPKTGERLREYVAGGGVYVALHHTDSMNGYGLFHEFGIEALKCEGGDCLVQPPASRPENPRGALRIEGTALRLSGGLSLAAYHGEDMAPRKGACAIAEAEREKGRFLAIGFPWLQLDPQGFRAFLLDQMRRVPAAPPCVIDNLFVESGLFAAPDGKRVLIVYNASACEQGVRATLGCHAVDAAGDAPLIEEINLGLDCRLTAAPSSVILTAAIPPRNLAVFILSTST